MLPQAARDHDEGQRLLTASAIVAVRNEWVTIGDDFDTGWNRVGPRITTLVAAAQHGAAVDAADYIVNVLAELDLPQPAALPDPAMFAGAATQLDGPETGSLDALLYGAVTRARETQASSLQQRLTAGMSWLSMVVGSQVADAGRDATSVAVAATPRVGWVRMVSTPCCSRCAVLAGRWYRWNASFARHPRCQCRSIPAAEDRADSLTTDPKALVQAGMVRGLSAADTRAIVEDGADVSRVINARRGMGTAVVAGRQLATTTEARRLISRQANASGRGFVRLRPEAIYQVAEDRADAVRLLRRYGYLQ